MLVLSRKQGERVVIGGQVVVTVLEIRADRVRLAFDAPREIPIHREEVYQRVTASRTPEAAPRPSRATPESPFFAECA